MFLANSWFMKFLTSKKLIISLGLVGHLALLIRYNSQMGDFGDFVKAGQLIWEGTNPYSSLMYVNSPVSAVLAYGLSKVLPFIFFPAFWQILNLLGIFVFFKIWLRREVHSQLLLAVAMLSLLNVTRALIANVQVTGLVLGSFALGVLLSRKGKSPFFIMLPIWVAAELKPQLALGFIAFFLFYKGIQFARISILILYVFLSHFLIEFRYSGSIHSEWLAKVLSYSKTSLNEGYEISYWKGIALSLGQSPMIKTVSVLLLIVNLIFIVYMALRSSLNWAIFGALVLPFQNTYLHLYDLAPLGVLIILGAICFSKISSTLLFVLFIQVFPLNFSTHLAAALIFLLLTSVNLSRPFKIPKFFSISILSISIFYLSVLRLSDQSEELQIIFCLVFPAMVLLGINARKYANLFELGRI